MKDEKTLLREFAAELTTLKIYEEKELEGPFSPESLQFCQERIYHLALTIGLDVEVLKAFVTELVPKADEAIRINQLFKNNDLM